MEDRCLQRVIHEEVVDQAKGDLLPEDEFENLAQLFKGYADKSRLKIIHALASQEMCVCDLAALLDISESAVSHQLRLMRNLRLVKNRRDGNVLYYSLYDDHCHILFKTGLCHSGGSCAVE